MWVSKLPTRARTILRRLPDASCASERNREAVAALAAVTDQLGSIHPLASSTEAFDALSHRLVAIDLAAAHISEQGPHGRDLRRLDRQHILRQHREIRELAGLDRAFDV